MAREAVERTAVAALPRRMTYEEWKARNLAREGTKTEWVDGEVIVFMPTTIRHARIRAFLSMLMSLYARLRGLGEIFDETVEMRLEQAARVPDILFVATDHLGRLEAARLRGPADLVVEFVSSDSVERHRNDKFAEYAAAGVPEYWLIDFRTGWSGAAFFRLVDGAYQEAPLDAEGRYRSVALPGFRLRPAWLWQDPLPNPWPLVAQIAPEAARAALAELGPKAGDGSDASESGTSGARR